jgi:hypothetical protein
MQIKFHNNEATCIDHLQINSRSRRGSWSRGQAVQRRLRWIGTGQLGTCAGAEPGTAADHGCRGGVWSGGGRT